MKVWIILVMVLLLAGFFILAQGNLYLNDSQDRERLVDLYGKWMVKLVEKGKTVTGYVISPDWLPDVNNSKK